MSSLTWDPLAVIKMVNSSVNFKDPTSSSQKLLSGRMEFTLVLMYATICVGGLLANIALILAILGKYNSLKYHKHYHNITILPRYNIPIT